MLDPERFASPSLIAGGSAEIRPADTAFVLGDYDTAASAYSADIRAGDDPTDAWTGLALTRQHQPTAATPALLRCPESVRALHDLLSAGSVDRPDPEALAAWVSAMLTATGARSVEVRRASPII